MTKIGIGLPGISVADTRASAEAIAVYPFESFSVYGDLGDLPPYAVLHASAEILRNSAIRKIGPMGIPVSLIHPEVVSVHAAALEEQLPLQTAIGLVRGAFLEQIGEKPASLQKLKTSVEIIRDRLAVRGLEIPLYLGGFGARLLSLAGHLAVQGVKLGGSTNPVLAKSAKEQIANPNTAIVMGAVSVIDPDRKAARKRARFEVAKYLKVVGHLDHTLDQDDQASLATFVHRFDAGDTLASDAISDSLLDKFALAGTPDDALRLLEKMNGIVDRFEFGTPHGLGTRPEAIRYIGDTILNQLGDNAR